MNNATKKENLIFLAICFFAVLLVYGQTLAGDFVFDDRGIVDRQALLSNYKNFGQIVSLPYWTAETGAYRPVTLVTYALNYILLGKDSSGFHLINIILYALTGFLIFLLVKKLFSNKILGYLSAILFLVLPIHTEVVAGIVGRAEILALFFSLLAFWELTREKISFWRVGFWFLLAIGSKETAIAALPVALFVVYFKEKRIFNREIFRKYLFPAISLITGAGIYFAARFLVLGHQYFLGLETSLVENPLKFVAPLSRIITALKVFAIYLSKSVWPFNLCSDYSYNQIPVLHNFWNLETISGLAGLLFFTIGIFIFLKRAPILSLGSAFFLFAFLPISNLIFPTGTIAGERLTYYPSVGICFYLAFLFVLAAKLKPRRFFGYLSAGFFFALVIFYGTVAFLRSGDWLTERRLFSSAAKCAPDSVLSRSNLGAVYYLEGNLAAAKTELLAAQGIYDGYPKGVNNLGLVYWKEGNKEKARELFLKALGLRFPYYGAYENLALVDLEEGKIDEAKKWLVKFYSGNEEAAEIYIKNYFLIKNQ